MSDERVGPCGEHCAVVYECDARGREITRLRAENEKLRAALAFYTKEENWRRNGPLDANGANYTGGPATSIIKDTEND